ncbi:MAG: hypothetical protein ACE144_06940 [Thermodesulfobacteriota bacterium]
MLKQQILGLLKFSLTALQGIKPGVPLSEYKKPGYPLFYMPGSDPFLSQDPPPSRKDFLSFIYRANWVLSYEEIRKVVESMDIK